MIDLLTFAEAEGIEVYYGDIPECGSMSIPDNVCLDYRFANEGAEERVRLAHEIGHCVKGAFYNQYSTHDVVAKHEYRANKWAIEKLVPEDELNEAVSAGYLEPWELADYFCVTEEIMKKAMDYYWRCEQGGTF